MDDSLGQVRREIACAQRIVGGLSDDHSRRVVRAYIRELEERIEQARPLEHAA